MELSAVLQPAASLRRSWSGVWLFLFSKCFFFLGGGRGKSPLCMVFLVTRDELSNKFPVFGTVEQAPPPSAAWGPMGPSGALIVVTSRGWPLILWGSSWLA